MEEISFASGSWQITAAAASRLAFGVGLDCPRIFMKVDKNRDPEELSVFELMLFLEDRGWECRAAGSRDLTGRRLEGG